jgi:site-specific recombinase XerD
MDQVQEVNIYAVQKRMGHPDLKTTEICALAVEKDLSAVVNTLDSLEARETEK